DLRIEILTKIGSNQRHFSTIRTHAVRQIEVLDPWPRSVIGLNRNSTEFQTRHPRLKNVQARIDHRLPLTKLPKLHSIRLSTNNPSSAIVGGIPRPDDPCVNPNDIAVPQEPVSADGGICQTTMQGPRS